MAEEQTIEAEATTDVTQALPDLDVPVQYWIARADGSTAYATELPEAFHAAHTFNIRTHTALDILVVEIPDPEDDNVMELINGRWKLSIGVNGVLTATHAPPTGLGSPHDVRIYSPHQWMHVTTPTDDLETTEN